MLLQFFEHKDKRVSSILSPHTDVGAIAACFVDVTEFHESGGNENPKVIEKDIMIPGFLALSWTLEDKMNGSWE